MSSSRLGTARLARKDIEDHLFQRELVAREGKGGERGEHDRDGHRRDGDERGC